MPIEVELYGGLAPHRPRKQLMQPGRPVTAGEVARLLDVPPSLLGLIIIDGVQSEPDDTVPEGARVCLFPYLSGG